MPLVKATMLRKGFSIVVRNQNDKIVAESPMKTVDPHPDGCSRHVHVQLEDKRRWCYDEGAIVEMS